MGAGRLQFSLIWQAEGGKSYEEEEDEFVVLDVANWYGPLLDHYLLRSIKTG